MAVNAHKLGPGTLRFGETGDEKEFGSQVTKCEVTPSWADDDPIPVLSGEEYSEPGEFEGTISGEFLQDYGIESLVKWTWDNTGTKMPFTFTPRTDKGMTLTGECVVMAVKIGGDVKTANTTEFEWRVTSLPTMSAGAVEG